MKLMLKLREVYYNLLKYCHHSSCTDPISCPLHDYKCKRLLGLNTAIAWYAAQSLHKVYAQFLLEQSRIHLPKVYPVTLTDGEIYKLYTGSVLHTRQMAETISSAITTIKTLRDVIDFHKHEYRSLSILLDKALDVLDQLRNDISIEEAFDHD